MPGADQTTTPPGGRANERTIFYTVIVPVYNHWHLIPKLLHCLAAQTIQQHDFEVILVDNASEKFDPPENLEPNVQILSCETPGSYAARNTGIEQAQGKWLAFTDADCRPKPDWLQNLMAAIEHETTKRQNDKTTKPSNEPIILAGPVKMVADHTPPNRYEIYDLVRGIPQAWYVSRGYAATANLAIPAPLMQRLGGFDASRQSGGDAELCRRARAAGAILEYVPDAVVEHPARESWPELVAKTRRIKAAQAASGDWLRRLRSLLPPVVEAWKYLRARPWPWRYRTIAIAVQLALWPIEALETVKPVTGRTAIRSD